MSFVLIFLGGGAGACLRFLLSLLLGRYWPTLTVNVLGSLILVLLLKYGRDHGVNQYLLRVGFLGSLTTFSAFSYEALTAFQRSDFILFFGIICSNIFLGIGLPLLLSRVLFAQTGSL